ncbi:TadE/TadG family type IV pilus assembly protein [Vibrio splendidus]|uniref:TadE/TadG family type IV pilus assembly protein n=1 Tax=Vibrio splendidus TaxID=29497 RepID=UPI00148C3D50|nr:TadE family protein [Vibrio splendidus]NOJ06687.1 pilus assembly protein [Vibrio splendidus]
MLSRQKGAQTVEFAMLVVPFLILIIGFFEICRLLLVNIILDVAVNAGVREAKTRPISPISDQAFTETIAKFPLISKDKISLSSPLYAENFSDLVNEKPVSKSRAVLGEYKVSYSFSFALLPNLSTQFSESIGNMTTLKRKVLVSYDNK